MEDPHETEYGQYQYAEDLDGHYWLFSRHAKGRSLGEWELYQAIAAPGTIPCSPVNWRKIAISNNVGDVKDYVRTRLHALVSLRSSLLATSGRDQGVGDIVKPAGDSPLIRGRSNELFDAANNEVSTSP